MEEIVGAGRGEADGGGGVIFREPMLEFGADASLQFGDCGWGSRRSKGFGGVWNRRRPGGRRSRDVDEGGGFGEFGREVADGCYDALGVEMPLGEKAVGRQVAVKRARSDAIEIRDVNAHDSAESIEIEMRVADFERVEGPFDEADVAREGFLALE